MKLTIIETGTFKLDGGAMFGIVPKPLWERQCPPDESNRCTWSMRCLLLEQGDRKILVDTGIGDKQDAKFQKHFAPKSDVVGALTAKGMTAEEITDVFLTHLHFDHAGGAVRYDKKGQLVPTFPNATYWTNEVHWNWAMQPNAKERNSFLRENLLPLHHHDRLRFIDVQRDELKWMDDLHIYFAYGHTEALMGLRITTDEGTFLYPADLLPSAAHFPTPYVMSYDIRPLQTMEEKEWLLPWAHDNDYTFIFEHDAQVPMAKVGKDERGIYRPQIVTR
ncbi:MAG: MBL fold metallo-hydrolase [Bacteroidota bacterium]